MTPSQAERHNRVESIFILHPRLRQILDKIDRYRRWSMNAAEPYCLLVLGPAGAGKTTLMRHFVESRRDETGSDRTIVPVLTTTIPVPATMKTMATSLLKQLGDPLADKGTLDQKTQRLIKLVDETRVEVIILDEFQHFIDRDSERVTQSVADWLKNLITLTQVPVVLIGLPAAQDVLAKNEQLRRRFSAQEHLSPFTCDESGNGTLLRLLEQLDQVLPFDEPSLGTPDMAKRFYNATKGLIGPIMKIVRAAAHAAIEDNSRVLVMEYLRDAKYQEFQQEGDDENPFHDVRQRRSA